GEDLSKGCEEPGSGPCGGTASPSSRMACALHGRSKTIRFDLKRSSDRDNSWSARKLPLPIGWTTPHALVISCSSTSFEKSHASRFRESAAESAGPLSRPRLKRRNQPCHRSVPEQSHRSRRIRFRAGCSRSEEHTSELQSRSD